MCVFIQIESIRQELSSTYLLGRATTNPSKALQPPRDDKSERSLSLARGVSLPPFTHMDAAVCASWQQLSNQLVKARNARVRVGAHAKTVRHVNERHAARLGCLLVTQRVSDEDRRSKRIPIDDALQVVCLWQAAIAPALEIAEQLREAMDTEKRLDIAGLTIADHEQRQACGQPSETCVHTGIKHAAQLGDRTIVLGRGFLDQNAQLTLAQSVEGSPYTCRVRHAGHGSHVGRDDGSERDRMAREHAVPRDGARLTSIPQRPIQVENHRVEGVHHVGLGQAWLTRNTRANYFLMRP